MRFLYQGRLDVRAVKPDSSVTIWRKKGNRRDSEVSNFRRTNSLQPPTLLFEPNIEPNSRRISVILIERVSEVQIHPAPPISPAILAHFRESREIRACARDLRSRSDPAPHRSIPGPAPESQRASANRRTATGSRSERHLAHPRRRACFRSVSECVLRPIPRRVACARAAH